MNKRTVKNRIKKLVKVLFFTLPAMIPMAVFWIYPILKSGWLSFTDWDYMTPDYNYVGVENYTSVLTNSSFWSAFKTTFLFAIGTIIPIIIIGLFVALLLENEIKGKSIYRFLVFSPWVTPTVAISIVWSWIFEPKGGLANEILSTLGLPELQWINSSETALLSVIIVTVWKAVGYSAIFYLTAIDKIPRDRYEAASLDGAGFWKKLFYITLPGVSPTTFFLCIITMVDALKAYDQIQILTQGGPAGSTRTLTYLFYQLGFEQFKMGQASAVAIIIVAITVALSYTQFRLSKRWVNY
ncbi:multiple sugar transport system permease protein [Lachnospiraceae bacterium NE2001]|nr:multiple sugar transport system permease protein [Lachnospiraceae bacterium NE2001]